MKQVEITIDMAIDMLPVVGEIYDKLNVQSYAEEQMTEDKKTDEEAKQELGMKFIFSYVFKKSKDIKTELIELAAIAYGVSNEEAAKLKWSKVIAVILAIKNDEELNDFF